jgi:hypothetical protein
LGTKEPAVASRKHTSFSTREYSTKNNRTVIPHSPYFSLFPCLKIKLKDRHFDTLKAIEKESQAVLNTLKEQDFQDVFKKGHMRSEECISMDGDYFEGDGGQ